MENEEDQLETYTSSDSGDLRSLREFEVPLPRSLSEVMAEHIHRGLLPRLEPYTGQPNTPEIRAGMLESVDTYWNTDGVNIMRRIRVPASPEPVHVQVAPAGAYQVTGREGYFTVAGPLSDSSTESTKETSMNSST